MSPERNLQAVIFDLDGLMVDSEPLARQAWDDVLADFGYRLDDTTYYRMVGRRTRESAELVRDSFRCRSLPKSWLRPRPGAGRQSGGQVCRRCLAWPSFIRS
jgi:hypothetical protein